MRALKNLAKPAAMEDTIITFISPRYPTRVFEITTRLSMLKIVFGLEEYDLSGILHYKNGYHRITIHRRCTEPFLIALALAFCWITHEGEAKRITPSSHESDVKHIAKMGYELITAVLYAAKRYGMQGVFNELRLLTGHRLYLQSCPRDQIGRKIRQLFHPWTPPATPPSLPNSHEFFQEGQLASPMLAELSTSSRAPYNLAKEICRGREGKCRGGELGALLEACSKAYEK